MSLGSLKNGGNDKKNEKWHDSLTLLPVRLDVRALVSKFWLHQPVGINREWFILLDALHAHFDLSTVKEFTIEANPDDLTPSYLQLLKKMPVNRLSIGVQSFEDAHLKWMNRAHNASEALSCIKNAQEIGISNISIDLIYGLPNLEEETWRSNLKKAFDLKITHLSSYCLTIELKTVFVLIGLTKKISKILK